METQYFCSEYCSQGQTTVKLSGKLLVKFYFVVSLCQFFYFFIKCNVKRHVIETLE